MDVALTILALITGALVLELFTAARAPVGHQDENGFHFGIPATQRPDQSLLSAREPKRVKAPQLSPVENPLEPVTVT